jgi:RimJ/RimL family protein N-acetyltransferase
MDPRTFEPAPRTGRYCRLGVIEPSDYPRLYEIEFASEGSEFYRHRGAAVAPDVYAATLWAGVLSQWKVCALEKGGTIGLVAAYGADLRNGHAHIAGIIADPWRRRGWVLEAWVLFISYLFATFPLVKLYADVLEPNLATSGRMVERVGRLEGILRGHELHGDQRIDQYLFAIYRDDWFELVGPDRGLGFLRREPSEGHG